MNIRPRLAALGAFFALVTFPLLQGDAALPNKTIVPATVSTNAGVCLLHDGGTCSQALMPSQHSAAVAYSKMAGIGLDGATNAVVAMHGTQLGNSAVGKAQPAPGQAASNLNAADESAVADGGLASFKRSVLLRTCSCALAQA